MPFPILPLIAAFGPELVKLIPQLGSIFGSGSEVATRNVAAATMVTDAIVKATGAPNLQAAVETMQTDPEGLKAAKAAVDDLWPSIGEAGGGGIKAAREMNAASEQPLFKQAPFMLALIFVPLIYAVVAAALLKFDWMAEMPSETRSMVVGFVMGTIAGGILAYFYGTTQQSNRKTELLSAK